MNKVVDLLKLPCFDKCYIIAGISGIFNQVNRIDILETPFPEVEKYFEPNEFSFTSFWNHKDDKERRIKLVESLINHKSAGIGIMPGLNLNDKIDQEILDLADRHSFPIMYIPSNVRWSDVISDYSLLNNYHKNATVENSYADILSAFSELHTEKNIQHFCERISQLIDLPIVIHSNNIYSHGLDNKILSETTAKLYDIKSKKTFRINAPISLHINNENLSIVYFGYHSIMATYISTHNITNPRLEVFHKIAPLVAKELDFISRKGLERLATSKATIEQNTYYYIVVIRKDDVYSLVNYINSKYLIYETNEFYNYIILLIENELDKTEGIYCRFNRIFLDTDPSLFVFSNYLFSANEIYNQIRLLKTTLSNLLFLNGIFHIDEIPLLYMAQTLPYKYKEDLAKLNSTNLNIGIDSTFYDTLRLYLVLKNVKDVSDLLGIHSNSVKYRISKCLDSNDHEIHSDLSSIPNLRILLMLEILKIEGPTILNI